MPPALTKGRQTRDYGRAGRYVKQAAGYEAFIPAPLPPKPPVRLSGKLQVLLSDATLALGRLDGSIHTLPNPDLFVLMYVRKEAVLSSQIEGTQSSLQDVLAAEAKILDPSTPRDVAEVLNYISAMRYGLRRLDEIPVSVRLIKELHEKLMHGVRGSHLTPGELRKTQNWIGHGGATLKNALFVPPPPGEIPAALGDLERFLHKDSEIPLLIQIGLAHAQFETIHPFLDGNGRVGRLLITFLLRQRNVLQKPVLYLSHFLKRHRQEYYERLQATRDKGDWESWLEFFLRGVAEVSGEATETARKILVLRETHREAITENVGRAAANGHRVLESLYKSPITNVKTVSEMGRTSFAAANELVKKLVAIGILKEMTGQRRNRSFRYDPYIELFT
jgi:Fic family protein